MTKPKFETPDLAQENIEKLQALFPNCVTEGRDENGKLKKAVNFELLQQMLSDDIADKDEAYEFTWVGKNDAIVEANKPIRKTLRPCKEESVNWDTTENLYIEGDNLEVLKLLQESYLGKVKMIYIDPPYNTGNDFIYRDDFTSSSKEYAEESGQIDDDGNRMFKNTDTNGRFHSDWCSMIYSRLLLARNLLSDDGVIAISIGHQEVHNLIKICQEIFGDRQIMSIAVQTSGGKPNGVFNITNEFIVFIFPTVFETIAVEEDMKEYSSPYHGMNLATFNQVQRPNQAYPIFVDKEGIIIGCGKSIQERIDEGSYKGEIIDFVYDFNEAPKDAFSIWPITNKGEQCVWRLIPSRLMADWSKGYIKVVPNASEKNSNKYSIQYLSGGVIEKIINKEVETFKISNNPRCPTIDLKEYKTAGTGIDTIWTDKKFYTTKGSNELKEIFGNKYFSYPKPLDLILNIIKRIVNSNDVILDFFSGSATTAHAVMQLNAEDGGNRKFIMVQLPEVCDEKSEAFKAGYKNICEIGKERIRRAGAKIVEEMLKQVQNDNSSNSKLDIGFRVLKVADSNMKDVYYSAAEYEQEKLDLFESNIKEDRNDLDLLFGCLLDWGLPLSLPYTSEATGKFTVHTYNGGDLVACFDEAVSEDVVKQIARKKPLRAVFRDSSFASSSSKINVFEIFKMISPETSVKVI